MRFFDLPFLVSRPRTSACVYLSETTVVLACTAACSSLSPPAYSSAGEGPGVQAGLDPQSHILLSASPLRSEGNFRAGGARGEGEMLDVLKKQVSELGLSGAGVSLVLAPDFYNISLMERPEVADSEVKEAVRWRLQDTLEYPLEQAVIDTFAMPAAATKGRADMIFVVSIQKTKLQNLITLVLAAGLKPDCVDITEMALRNISHLLYPDQQHAVGLLRMTPRSGIVNITQGHKLYLSRRLTGTSVAFQESEWDVLKESILLQVQRSMDYHESALAQTQSSIVLVTATQSWERQIVEYLEDMLPVAVTSLNEALCKRLNITIFGSTPVLLSAESLSAEDARAVAAALPAIGGLLRKIEAAGILP